MEQSEWLSLVGLRPSISLFVVGCVGGNANSNFFGHGQNKASVYAVLKLSCSWYKLFYLLILVCGEQVYICLSKPLTNLLENSMHSRVFQLNQPARTLSWSGTCTALKARRCSSAHLNIMLTSLCKDLDLAPPCLFRYALAIMLSVWTNQ